jgi:FMN phosphatase YigB (HAD superfamily)
MCPIKLVGFDLDDCLHNSTGLSERARIKGIDAMISLGLNIERQKALILIQEIVTEYGSNSSQHYDYFIRRLNQYEKISISFNEQVRYVAAAVMAYHAQKIKHIKSGLENQIRSCFRIV